MDRCLLPYISPATRCEAAAVPLPAERQSGGPHGAVGRALRQEARTRARRAARAHRAPRRLGKGAPRSEATAGVDARPLRRRGAAGQTRARDAARRAPRLATRLHLLLPFR